LVCERGIKMATKAQQEQVQKAIDDVDSIPPSVPEHIFQETGATYNHSGSGDLIHAQGENAIAVVKDNARVFNSGGGAMHFGEELI
jgi:hypothetical protein